MSKQNEHQHHDVLEELKPQHRALRQMIPDVYRGFGEMSGAALAAGTLKAKVKELMAMVIGVVHGCDGSASTVERGRRRCAAMRCGPQRRVKRT